MKKTYKKAFARVEGLCYTLPWLIGFLAFTLYPILSSIYYSFTDFSITNTPKWIGLANYIEIFTKDKLAIPSLIVTFKYVFLSVPAKLIFALLIAMLLSSNMKGVKIYRTVYYLPSILGGSVAIAVLWRFLFRRDGIVNLILEAVGLHYVDWIGSPTDSSIRFTIPSRRNRKRHSPAKMCIRDRIKDGDLKLDLYNNT